MSEILTQKVVTKRIKPDGSGYTVAAGVTNVTSDPVDTAGYEGVRFICGFGAIVAGAATSVKVRQGQQANMGDGADLAGSGTTVTDTQDNNVVITEIWQPQERYVDHVISRATQNSTVDFLIVELFGSRKKPVTQDATVVAGTKVLASPDEGTP